LAEISQLLNDLYENLENQDFEAKNLLKDKEKICAEIALKIDEITGILDLEIEKSNEILKEIEKNGTEAFIEKMQRVNKENRVLERNLEGKRMNLQEKKDHEKNCDNWKKRNNIGILQRFLFITRVFFIFH